MEKLVLGYIGNGKSTNRYHLPFVLQRTDKFEVKKIYARHLEKKEWDRIDGVTYTDRIEDLYEDAEINTIVVCTSSNVHYAYVKDVLSHGKNCICEKPFMETVEQAKECYDLAKKNGLVLACYQNRRFDSDFLTVQKVIESGKLGEVLEVEMSFDYFRPEIPENVQEYSWLSSYLYGHGCHTLDQVISYWGKPDHVHYDVRQTLGEGRMNDYFDLDLYYGVLKVSVKSSYFRIKERPSFVVYGRNGMFIKAKKDLQERDLKHFYMPDHSDFGVDGPEDYGTLTYMEDGVYHEEKVVSEKGDYGRYYDAWYETIMHGAELLVKPEETLLQLEMLQTSVKKLK